MLNKEIDGYKITKFLGKGGFGEVYQATKDGSEYAIKFIRTDFIQKDLEAARLRAEIAALKKVDSEYTVHYFGDGEYTENFTNYRYIVMELVEGQTLREVLQSDPAPWEESRAIAFISEVAHGLEAIHAQNIIHRDLKPENIKITPDGKIKILDYGLSRIIDYTSITQTGAQLGTFYYMSPEQVRGDKPIRTGSDYYSVGIILYELITGQILFYPSTDAEIIYKTIHVKPPYPTTVNPAVTNQTENVILTLLSKEVFNRYASIEEIIKDLNSKIPTRPVREETEVKFYPRVIQTDTNIILEYLKENKLDGVDFPINLHAQYQALAKALSSRTADLDFFSDPGTNRLVFSSFRKTKGLKALPYAPNGFDPIDTVDFDDVDKIKLFVQKTVDLQIANGCNILIAPFFYFDNTADEWFTINIKLLRETVDYVKAKYPQYAVAGSICTTAEELCRKREREKIIENYGHCETQYLQFYLDKITDTTVDAQIFNLITTGLAIRQYNKTKLIACRVPAVSLGLLTVGFSATTSGLACLESFDKGVITKEEDMAIMPTRRYFPDLLMTVTTNGKSKLQEDILAQEATIKAESPKVDFSFSCACAGCTNSAMTDGFQKPRLHFLLARQTEIAELNALPVGDRRDYFIKRIDKAYYLQQKLIEHGVKLPTPEYLQTWKEMLLKF